MSISQFLKPEDLTAGKPVVPGWNQLEIVKYSEEKTKDKPNKPSDGSVNAIFEFKIIAGPAENMGRVIRRYFNEKALGFGDSLWATLFPESYVKGKGGNINGEMFLSSVGKKLEGYVKMGDDGKFPDISDYRPISK